VIIYVNLEKCFKIADLGDESIGGISSSDIEKIEIK